MNDFYKGNKNSCRKGNELFCLGREIKTKEKIAMRNVTVIKVYNLVNNKGNKLHLRLGELKSRDDAFVSSADKGLRWSFVGVNIPMPVRSMTWFNGFPENIMLDWLKGNGWYVQTCVNMCDGNAKVYDVPKGNEEPSRELSRRTFNAVIRNLVYEGKQITAAHVYRHANGCDLRDAHNAVMKIVDEQD